MNPRVAAALRSNPKNPKAMWAARKAWIDYSQRKEPKDDRGRLFQTTEILRNLKRKPAFLETALSGLSVYAITLGELGTIFWAKDSNNKWASPRWSASTRVFEGKSPIPDRDIRNGTECGDVSRAGFVAALLLLASDPKKLQTTTLPMDGVERAVEWANWFGATKLQFFSLYDYIAFLQRRWKRITALVNGRQRPGLGKSSEYQDLNIRTDNAFLYGKHHPSLLVWNKVLKKLGDEGSRRIWDEKIIKWVKARRL
jgi:hypothetical protein